MKLPEEDAMVSVLWAADRLNRSILPFPAFSDPMLVPKMSRSSSPSRPWKAKVGLLRLLRVNKVSQHHKQEYSEGG